MTRFVCASILFLVLGGPTAAQEAATHTVPLSRQVPAAKEYADCSAKTAVEAINDIAKTQATKKEYIFDPRGVDNRINENCKAAYVTMLKELFEYERDYRKRAPILLSIQNYVDTITLQAMIQLRLSIDTVRETKLKHKKHS